MLQVYAPRKLLGAWMAVAGQGAVLPLSDFSQLCLGRSKQLFHALWFCLVFFFEELFTLHPACLWARETLGLGLKLWTNRHETFSTACIISVVETYLCHNQLVERQYCLEWLLWHGIFLSGIPGSWNGSIFSSTIVGAVHTGDPVLWVSAQWSQATEQEGNSPVQTRYQFLYLSASSRPWSGICGSTAAHPHDLVV